MTPLCQPPPLYDTLQSIDGDRGAYGIVIVDMPGACCAMGATVDEALAAAEVALADFAKLMEENGETIPTPSAIETLNWKPEKW